MPGPLRFIVHHPGARLHYAVPALLARAGMLERFYTDLHAPTGRALSWVGGIPSWILPAPLARLAGRQLPEELRGRTSSAPFVTLRDWMRGASRRRGPQITAYGAEASVRARILREQFRGANAIYTLSNADLELVQEAKSRGLFVVYEQVINPHVGRILREERERFPGIEPQDPVDEIEGGIARDEAQWRLADLVVGASRFVCDEVLEHGIAPDRVAVVPYGIPSSWLTIAPEPRPGRLLFVGSVGLRKGAHYLAAASRILRERGVAHEVRAVGPYHQAVIARPEFAGPTYVGQVPRPLVREEFRTADLFVFPTLAEGFALVHLEALACGVPVITTPHCGSVVRDGIDGFVVPTRDATALADRVQQLQADRALRARMSQAARARAAEFVWERYASRLLEAIHAAAALPRSGYSLTGTRPSSVA
jgi:glycosyltransferase involved in cell wall biosynthesis